jgi:hypothetical protein
VSEAKRRSSILGISILATIALLLTGTALFVTIVPRVPCKPCLVREAFDEQIHMERHTSPDGKHVVVGPSAARKPLDLSSCTDCGGRMKMTLLRSWLRPSR